MKFDEDDWFVILLIPISLIVIGVMTFVDTQQQRVLFQQTYNKNLECRQALKDKSVSIANEICGDVPIIGDFVK